MYVAGARIRGSANCQSTRLYSSPFQTTQQELLGEESCLNKTVESIA